MGRTTGRTPEQTRRLVLDAAASVIRQRGIIATLDDIARAAGVSKGGLVYHFATKDELVQALAADVIRDFRSAVTEALDPAEPSPGRLTRAYVRASLDLSANEDQIAEKVALAAQLMTSLEVSSLIRVDAQQWDAELRNDGLPEDLLTLVIAAADGASTASVWGGFVTTPNHELLKEQLIALTYAPGRWTRAITG